MFDKAVIEHNIRENIPGSQVSVLSEDGVHFFVQVVYDGFAGKSLLTQHRMVYDAVGSGVGIEIHALSIKTSIA